MSAGATARATSVDTWWPVREAPGQVSGRQTSADTSLATDTSLAKRRTQSSG
jgi:hypothetical protein